LNSAILGKSRDPSDDEEEFMIKMKDECPIRLFQLLNKKLNTRGFMLHISNINGGDAESAPALF